MRLLIVLVLVVVAFNSSAKSEIRSAPMYIVVSDEAVTNVEDGFCRVKGNVKCSGVPFVNGMIANYGITIKTRTDSFGNYEFLIPESTNIIFFYAPGQTEIVINPYDFKSGHEVVINFNTWDNIENTIVDKPVIYMYSSKVLDVAIEFDFQGELKFTYPKYYNGWNVCVDQNKIVDYETGRGYPYLFWEGEMEDLAYVQNGEVFEGFLIQTDSVISFLEDQLTNMGFNDRERTDFITFWSPRMIRSEFNLVQFLVDEDYADNIATISICPEPDHMKRVYLLFTPLDKEPEFTIVSQAFDTLERDGFTVLEWGGSEIKLNQIQL